MPSFKGFYQQKILKEKEKMVVFIGLWLFMNKVTQAAVNKMVNENKVLSGFKLNFIYCI